MDNIITALGQSNRVCQVFLIDLADRQLEKVLASMQVPFPELTELRLGSDDETPPVIPDSFLGGSAPHLRHFGLSGIPFPGLPNLLLSATHLVKLYLYDTPHSGYFSPEAMAALLSVLSNLKTLILEFRSPQSRPDSVNRRPPPSKRSVIPALDRFRFKGVIEYLEDLVTFIDAPQLDDLVLEFFNQTDFDGPRLAQFISRTPTFRARDKAHVEFGDNIVMVVLQYQASNHLPLHCPAPLPYPLIRTGCSVPDRQLSSVAQICNSCLPFLFGVENLYIQDALYSQFYSKRVWSIDAVDNTLWLELFVPFREVKNLYLSEDFAPGIATALGEFVGTEVLPSLQKIFVEKLEPSGPLEVFQENIGKFIAARELSGHSIATSVWYRSWHKHKRRRW